MAAKIKPTDADRAGFTGTLTNVAAGLADNGRTVRKAPMLEAIRAAAERGFANLNRQARSAPAPGK